MNNRVFNVNGKGSEKLLKVLELAFSQWSDRCTASAWMQTKEHGLILLWHKAKDSQALPADLSAKQCVPFVEQWLDGDYAKTVTPGRWDHDVDHDGHNTLGWRVYVEDWGKVGPADSYAICAIKPAYMWFGK